jgi:hypothetical protein
MSKENNLRRAELESPYPLYENGYKFSNTIEISNENKDPDLDPAPIVSQNLKIAYKKEDILYVLLFIKLTPSGRT